MTGGSDKKYKFTYSYKLGNVFNANFFCRIFLMGINLFSITFNNNFNQQNSPAY